MELPTDAVMERVKARLSGVFKRLDSSTSAQVYLRKDQLTDIELAEFELAMQNWIVDYLWPAPKQVPDTRADRVRNSFTINTLARRSDFLPFTKRAWEITLAKRDTFRLTDLDGKLLKATRDYSVLQDNDEPLTLRIFVNKFISTILIKPHWDDPDQPGKYEIVVTNNKLAAAGISIIFN